MFLVEYSPRRVENVFLNSKPLVDVQQLVINEIIGNLIEKYYLIYFDL